MTQKIYHIYAKDECLYHSLDENQFKITWNTLNEMVDLMKTDYSLNDLSYESVTRMSLNTTEEHSY